MEEITKLKALTSMNQLFGLETLHPLENVIDFSKATKMVDYYRMNIGFYSVSERRKMWRSQIWTEVL